MSGFEDRLRSGLSELADAYEPSPGLRAGVDRRVRRHRRRRRLAGAATAAAVLVMAAGAGLLLGSDDAGREAVSVAGPTTAPVVFPPCPTPSAPPGARVESSYRGLPETVALARAGDLGLVATVVCRDGRAVEPASVDGSAQPAAGDDLRLVVVADEVVAAWVLPDAG